MAAKESRSRKWSESELKVFAAVLADDETEFALSLETLALKKSSNLHIFEDIKKELDARLQKENACSSSTKKGKAIREIDTSVVKLRAKYKWLKDQWRKYTERAKTGSGKAAVDEPEWFHIIDPIFSETHTELKVATKAADIFDTNSEEEEDDEKEVKTEEIKPSTCSTPREMKQPFIDSSASSLDASSEQSPSLESESEEECNR